MVHINNPYLIVAPLTKEEAEELKKSHDFSTLYVLYKNEYGEIEIGIPDMVKYFPDTANMWGAGRATEKAYFKNDGSQLLEEAPSMTDRPVYKISPTNDRKVGTYEIINGVDVDLDSILNGSFTIGRGR